MQITELQNIMKECGIVGAGGAGFPSYAKLSMDADTVILNCAECEPLFKLHRQLLSEYAAEILWALDEVRETVGAKQAIVAVKKSYKEAIDAVLEHIDSYKNITISKLPEIYPAGDEIITIYETTGRVVEPGKLPITKGVIVFNVETILNTYFAIKENTPVCYKYITVAGEVKNPCTVRVPLGITFRDAVKIAGGEKLEDCEYLNGGAMTGSLARKNDVVTKTTNAVLVLPKDHPVILKKKTNTKVNIYRAMSACCQCKACTDLCSRNLLGHPIEPHSFMRAASKGMTSDIPAIVSTAYCSQCKLCEMYACPQGLMPGSLIGAVRTEIRAKGVTPPKDPKFKGVDEHRNFRIVPMERLISRLGIKQYNVEAPLTEVRLNNKELKIALSQHIGQPAKALVKKGDKVSAFEKIAACEGLGAQIHSPKDATVKNVTEKFIILELTQ
ncbi:MAG: SLBB domain-containing protein [Clostridia bacterium]|nr:SLBB domain-containing protein [Clostridia bacterium]